MISIILLTLTVSGSDFDNFDFQDDEILSNQGPTAYLGHDFSEVSYFNLTSDRCVFTLLVVKVFQFISQPSAIDITEPNMWDGSIYTPTLTLKS